jgi:hypothetical protein
LGAPQNFDGPIGLPTLPLWVNGAGRSDQTKREYFKFASRIIVLWLHICYNGIIAFTLLRLSIL